MRRIVELDGIRALAVGLVILDHYAPFRHFAHYAPARFGGIGVDVFFVLSGFLITSILLRSKHEPHPYKVFYARRSVRIFPAFILLLVFVYGAGALLGEPFETKKFVAQALFLRSFKGSGAVIHGTLAMLAHPWTTAGLFQFRQPVTPPYDYGRLPMSASLGPTWSLSVEEWFYFLWAPIVLLLSRRKIVIVSLVFCMLGLLFRWTSLGQTTFLTSLDVLVVGALLALWRDHRSSLQAPTVARLDLGISALALIAAIGWITVTWFHRDLISLTLLEIVVFGCFAWLLRHNGGNNPIAVLLRWQPLLYIGSISYMIYLIHLPLYFLVRHAVDVYGTPLMQPAQEWIIAITSAILALIFAAASWRFYEEPILRRKESMTRRLRAEPQ
jgi:peptidoglycan/LPS O-acetylase OafA/YrhL